MEPSSQSTVPGMESVIATVSGYHGSERFKLIKLIAHTGASYVGAMNRSTTHLVCWEFKGEKYELAQQLGTHIVSHCWFEDCLKAQKRIPEDPYSMKSGKEASPISWQLPVVLDGQSKQKRTLSNDWVVEPQQSNSMKSRELTDKGDVTCFEVVDLELSDSHLFDEDFGLSSKTNRSQNSKRYKKVRKCDSGSQTLRANDRGKRVVANDLDNWPESTSYSRNKRNMYDGSGTTVIGETARRSARLKRKNDRKHPLNSVIDDCNIRESNSNREQNRTETSLQNDDIGESIHVLNNFNNSSSNTISISENSQELSDFCNIGKESKERTEGDEEVELATQKSEKNLSCVICLTDYSSTRGILPCGHRFCYTCIQDWADFMNTKGKVSTCPLCKTNFSQIIKWEETTSSEQKIYSQSVPCVPSSSATFMVPTVHYNHDVQVLDRVCYYCHSGEPEDLVSCRICHSQWVHSYCLDPPLLPWTCFRCTDLRVMYQRFH